MFGATTIKKLLHLKTASDPLTHYYPSSTTKPSKQMAARAVLLFGAAKRDTHTRTRAHHYSTRIISASQTHTRAQRQSRPVELSLKNTRVYMAQQLGGTQLSYCQSWLQNTEDVSILLAHGNTRRTHTHAQEEQRRTDARSQNQTRTRTQSNSPMTRASFHLLLLCSHHCVIGAPDGCTAKPPLTAAAA